jgi:hypothetical protein
MDHILRFGFAIFLLPWQTMPQDIFPFLCATTSLPPPPPPTPSATLSALPH